MAGLVSMLLFPFAAEYLPLQKRLEWGGGGWGSYHAVSSLTPPRPGDVVLSNSAVRVEGDPLS